MMVDGNHYKSLQPESYKPSISLRPRKKKTFDRYARPNLQKKKKKKDRPLSTLKTIAERPDHSDDLYHNRPSFQSSIKSSSLLLPLPCPPLQYLSFPSTNMRRLKNECPPLDWMTFSLARIEPTKRSGISAPMLFHTPSRILLSSSILVGL
ncbi:hypothetical protein BC939DRAFT_306151 [Gamsiella multidivaricata]|uniref:uncharacterized protein n=1 Tax=Gamsiella multidivaricata TaxID=101098 RepID=UPI00222126B5|nr:uncharacterized protein BC939DRAFT_306151 [Gamsiella multidivaricata]KAI7818065.1 hypothetical protein BC939DRAFT_306151 [Gamsiella multidivaricata]